jgi:RNA polymerase sigma factor (sigma-70 family)
VLEPDQARKLVEAAANGDRSAWDRLVDEYAGLVWSVIRGCGLFGAEGADVSQTVWLRFVEHVGRLRDADRAGAWLATTARHECFRVLRRAGRQVVTADVPEVVVADEAETIVAALVAADDRDAVLVALEWIPPRCRELLRLMVAEPPPTYDDIAAMLGVPRGWIGPTRGRCIQHLRRVLTERGIRHISADSGEGKEAE